MEMIIDIIINILTILVPAAIIAALAAGIEKISSLKQ
jgi:hypothetical protein